MNYINIFKDNIYFDSDKFGIRLKPLLEQNIFVFQIDVYRVDTKILINSFLIFKTLIINKFHDTSERHF